MACTNRSTTRTATSIRSTATSTATKYYKIDANVYKSCFGPLESEHGWISPSL